MLAAQIASMKLISIKGIYVATLVYQLYRIQTAQTAPDLVVKQAGGQLQVRHPCHKAHGERMHLQSMAPCRMLRRVCSKSRAMRHCQSPTCIQMASGVLLAFLHSHGSSKPSEGVMRWRTGVQPPAADCRGRRVLLGGRAMLHPLHRCKHGCAAARGTSLACACTPCSYGVGLI